MRTEIIGVLSLTQSTRTYDKPIKNPFKIKTMYSSMLIIEVKMLVTGINIPNVKVKSGI